MEAADTAVRLRAGAALEALGELPAAIGVYRAAADADGDSVDTVLHLGAALVAADDLRGAEAAYGRALALVPDHADAEAALARVVEKRQTLADERRANRKLIQSYESAVRLDKWDAFARYNLGVALAKNGQWIKAEVEWKMAISLEPDYAAPYYQLAIAAYQRGQHREAWRQVRAAEARGYEPDAEFLAQLRTAQPEP